MNKWLFASAFALLFAGQAIASDKEDVLAVVHRWVDGFNKGDTRSALAQCADEAAIIDSLPPHEWHGAGACNAWFNDYGVWAKQNDAVFDHSTIGKVRHVEITGDRAYVVLSATFAQKIKGTLNSEKGIWTFAMKKVGGGWRMTGWAWTTP
jgi:ketosteroid isomerase-like protein